MFYQYKYDVWLYNGQASDFNESFQSAGGLYICLKLGNNKLVRKSIQALQRQDCS